MPSGFRGLGGPAVLLMFCALCSAADRPQRGQVTKATVNYSALHAGQKAWAAVVVEIKDGLHAQSHTPLDENFIKFEIKPDENPAVKFGEARYPPGKVEDYPALGKLSVYTGRVVTYIPLAVKADAKPGPIELTGKVTFQACDDKVCYPPESPKFTIKTEIVAAGAATNAIEPELFKDVSSSTPETAPPHDDRPSTAAPQPADFNKIFGVTLAKNAYALGFAAAFLIGIIFNAMPCVLPVVPLKALGFYKVSGNDRGKSILLGLVFSAGMVATFAAFGFLMFVRRAFDWGGLFTHQWFIALMVILLLLLSAGTFGLFTVVLPTAIYRLTPREDTLGGNFLFGVFTALLSTPCTFGMFVVVLAWATLQPALVGVLILVTVGAGMAFPYLVLSAFPELARRFPRAGPWGELVKQLMGFLLLLVAVYFARPFIERLVRSESFFWSLLFCGVVVAGLFLVIRSVQLSKRLGARLTAGVFAAAMIAGSAYLLRWLVYQPYQWVPYSAALIDQARAREGLVLVEFTAAWCANCQYLEKTVLHSDPIVETVRTHHVVMLRADVTTNDAPARPLLDELSPGGSIPLTVIYPPGSAPPIKLTGIYSTAELQRAIDLAAQPPAAVAVR